MKPEISPQTRSILITLGVILFVLLVALFKTSSAQRGWLRLRPVSEQVATSKAAGQALVVYFHSPGCSSCARVQTALEQVYPEFESDIMLLDVDVTKRSERSFVETSGVITTPTLLFISPDGRENLFVGEISTAQLRAELLALTGGRP